MQKKVHRKCRETFYVPEAGFEPARRCRHTLLKRACIPISTLWRMRLPTVNRLGFTALHPTWCTGFNTLAN